MADLARLAGVSATTVSLCLNQSPTIPVATRDRIVELARKHGYQPNPYVSALMRSRRNRVSLEHQTPLALVNGLGHPDAWRASPSAGARRCPGPGARTRVSDRGVLAPSRGHVAGPVQSDASGARHSGPADGPDAR